MFCGISSKTEIVGQFISSELLTNRNKKEAEKGISAGTQNLCSMRFTLLLSGETFSFIPESESSGGFQSFGIQCVFAKGIVALLYWFMYIFFYTYSATFFFLFLVK